MKIPDRQRIGTVIGGLIGGIIASGEDPNEVFLCIHEISEALKNPTYQKYFCKTINESSLTGLDNLTQLEEELKKKKD